MYKIGLVTTENKEEAKEIGKHLLKQKLVACVNILGEIESMYWWDKKIQKDFEYLFIFKTEKDKEKQIIEEVKELHSYENPEVIFLDLSEGSEEYLDWISKCTS